MHYSYSENMTIQSIPALSWTQKEEGCVQSYLAIQVGSPHKPNCHPREKHGYLSYGREMIVTWQQSFKDKLLPY